MNANPQPDRFCATTPLDDTLAFERELWNRAELVAGLDEAGRGCLAGPVVAGAVIFAPGVRIDGVADSKTLGPGRRAELALQIKSGAIAWATGLCTPSEIDDLNILWAAMEAMRRAAEALHPACSYALIDGNTLIPNLHCQARTIVKGDSRSHSIAAASILAKTHRDEIMLRLHREHPNYGWNTNVGYPTAAHYDALRTYGPNEHHRKSFRLS